MAGLIVDTESLNLQIKFFDQKNKLMLLQNSSNVVRQIFNRFLVFFLNIFHIYKKSLE